MINALSASMYDDFRWSSRDGTAANGPIFSWSTRAVFRNNWSSSDALGHCESIRRGILESPMIGVGDAVGSKTELSSPMNLGILEMELNSCETRTY